jgi:hypothetical protein
VPASSFRERGPPEFGCSCGRAAHCQSDARGRSRKVFPRLLEQHTRIPAVRSLSGLPPEHFFGQKAQTNFRNLKILRSNSTRISTDKIWHGLDWSAVASNLRAKDVKQNKQMTLSLSNSTTNTADFTYTMRAKVISVTHLHPRAYEILYSQTPVTTVWTISS